MGARHKLSQEQRKVLERAAKALGMPNRGQALEDLAHYALELLVLERRHIAARMHRIDPDNPVPGLADLQHDLAQGRS